MSKFLKTIFWIILIAALLVVAAIFIPPQLGIATEVVDSTQRSTNLPYASVSYMEPVDAASLSTGDVVVITEENAETAYKITGVTDAASGSYTVLNIADRTGATESMTLTGSVEKIIVTIPYIGYAAIATQSTEGYIILGLLLLFEVVLFILSELWKKNRNEDEREDAEEDTDEEPDDAAADETDAGAAGKSGNGREPAGADASAAPTISFSQTDISKEIAASIAAIQEEDEARAKQASDVETQLADTQETGSGKEDISRDPVTKDLTEEADSDGTAAERGDVQAAAEEAAATENLSRNPSEPGAEQAEKKTSAEEDGRPAAQQAADDGAMAGSGDFSSEGYTPEELNAEAAGPDGFVPVKRPTFDELMEQAKKKGEKPKVKKDDETGVTLVDYSDLI